jgi:hypothetical protein
MTQKPLYTHPGVYSLLYERTPAAYTHFIDAPHLGARVNGKHTHLPSVCVNGKHTHLPSVYAPWGWALEGYVHAPTCVTHLPAYTHPTLRIHVRWDATNHVRWHLA